MPFIDLAPIDAEGIRKDRPSHEVRWTTLTNVVFQDGSLVPRPGLVEFANVNEADLPGGFDPAPVLAIAELWNPGNTATGRESWTPAMEIIRPDGSADDVAGWTGGHTEIDETPPDDGSTKMTTSTEGAAKSITFGNPSTSFSTILGIVVKGRARNTQEGGYSTLNFYQGSVATANLLKAQRIYVSDDGETDLWQNFAFFVPGNVSDNSRFSTADINALDLVLELGSATRATAELLLPDADGNYTAWTDATNGGAATFSDFNSNPQQWNQDKSASTAKDYATTSTTDTRQSWSLDTIQTSFTTITSITMVCNFSIGEGNIGREHSIEFFYRVGGTDYTLETVSFGMYGGTKFHRAPVTATTNPVDSEAWEASDINNGEFGIRNADATGPGITLRNSYVSVLGTVSGQTLEVDTLSVEVMGVTSGLPGAGLRNPRIISSNFSHIRVDDDTGPDATFTDVTNSVPLDSTPSIMPYDHTILYGQIYMVNGVDPTVRYPNGSDVFEELATNNADGSTPITGRTVVGFADRILYGWVKDNTTVTPERIAWSEFQDGGDHNHPSAGDLDLLDTQGGVQKLLQLSEDLCFAGKEIGIYSLRRTGDGQIPFVRDVVDFETRCTAPQTCKRIVNQEGQPVILFLGWNPSTGYNVFAFDGARVIPVGDAIAPALRDDANHEVLRFAIAGVDPQTHTYWLGFAENNAIQIDSGYIFHIKTGAWTRFTLSWPVMSTGNWTLPSSNVKVGDNAIDGKPSLILGGHNNNPFRVLDTAAFDSLSEPASDAVTNSLENTFDNTGIGRIGRRKKSFTCTMETGDLRLPENKSLLGYRIHLTITNLGPVRIQVDVSDDGGVNYSTANTYFGGDWPLDNAKQHLKLDVDPRNANRLRSRIRMIADDDEDGVEAFWQIDEMQIEYQVGGTAP